MVIQESLQTGAKYQTRSLSCLSDGLVERRLFFIFLEKDVKTVARNYQRGILTNVVEPLNQIMFQNRQ